MNKKISRKFLFCAAGFSAGIALTAFGRLEGWQAVAVILVPLLAFTLIEGAIDFSAVEKIKAGDIEIELDEDEKKEDVK